MMNLILATTPTAPDVNFQMLLPELILSTAGVVVMLVDAFTRRRGRRWVTGSLALAGIIAGAWATLWLWGEQGAAGGTAFARMKGVDTLWVSFTLRFSVVAPVSGLISMILVE